MKKYGIFLTSESKNLTNKVALDYSSLLKCLPCSLLCGGVTDKSLIITWNCVSLKIKVTVFQEYFIASILTDSCLSETLY